jgi:hypothetical protein
MFSQCRMSFGPKLCHFYKIKKLKKSKHSGWPSTSFCWWCIQRFVSQSLVLCFARPIVFGITVLPKSDITPDTSLDVRVNEKKKAFLVAACEVLPQRNRRHSACAARVKTLLRCLMGHFQWITQPLFYTVSGGKTMLPIELLFSDLRIVRNLKRRTKVPGKLYGEIETKQFNTHKGSRRAIRKPQNS